MLISNSKGTPNPHNITIYLTRIQTTLDQQQSKQSVKQRKKEKNFTRSDQRGKKGATETMKKGGDGGGDGDVTWRSYGSSRPSWLQTTLADLDDKMKTLALNLQEEDDSDTFGERAENYYRKRPLLFNLLQHLYNSYLSLADRYCQSLVQIKQQQRHHHHPSSSSISSTLQSEINDDGWYDQFSHPHSDSEAESTISYQQPPLSLDIDTITAELVIKSVEYDILLNELGVQEKCTTESSRKMDLQRSLLEVLESERLILLNENARLGYQVTTLVEENKGLATESMLMRRKASELARCVLKMREDHRVCLLSRKIEDLQGQINGLEKRNREYYEQLVRREEDEKEEKNKKKRAVALEMCFEVEKMKMENQRLRLKEEEAMVSKVKKQGWKKSVVPGTKWWEKVRKFDMFLACGHANDS